MTRPFSGACLSEEGSLRSDSSLQPETVPGPTGAGRMREETEAKVPQAKPRRIGTSESLEDLSLQHSLADGRSSCGRLPA